MQAGATESGEDAGNAAAATGAQPGCGNQSEGASSTIYATVRYRLRRSPYINSRPRWRGRGQGRGPEPPATMEHPPLAKDNTANRPRLVTVDLASQKLSKTIDIGHNGVSLSLDAHGRVCRCQFSSQHVCAIETEERRSCRRAHSTPSTVSSLPYPLSSLTGANSMILHMFVVTELACWTSFQGIVVASV